jgi:hypothetical protein
LLLQTPRKLAFSNFDIINTWEMPANNSSLALKDFHPSPTLSAPQLNPTHGNMSSSIADTSTFMPSELNVIIKPFGK